MPFFEVVFETGDKSVAFYESDDEARRALEAHHARAINGEAGGPTGRPAERVKHVLKYDQHPADHNLTNTLSSDELKKALPDVIEKASMGGEVSIPMVAAGIRNLTDVHTAPDHRHDSQYKMKETGKLEGAWSK